jgi:hypothetical protein
MAPGHEEAQTYGYEGTKKAALEAFARNWQADMTLTPGTTFRHADYPTASGSGNICSTSVASTDAGGLGYLDLYLHVR